MAKMQTETVVITVTKLLKDTQEEEVILTSDTVLSLEAVVQELAGAGALVEVQKA
jgi:translation initiation factor IF-2